MSKRILDQIEAKSDTSSVEDIDTEALRLDKLPSQKKLFYEEEEDEEEEEEDNGGNVDKEIVDQGQYEAIDEAVNTKRVRFKRRQRDPVSDAESRNIRYWDFGPLIQQEFRDKLPSNYEIKRWKRPSKHMIRSAIQLLEANFETAIEQVLDRYNDELKSAVKDSATVHRQKHILMNDLTLKVKQQLKKTKFPSRISDRDADIEYIFAKRKYIQSRYAQELANAEKLEDELVREEHKLREVREFCQDLETSNKRKLQERLLKNDLHPSLTKAMENAYGLIPDSNQTEQGNTVYARDTQELQLVQGEEGVVEVSEDEHTSDFDEFLPALRDYSEVSKSIYENIDRFMKLNRVESILDKIDKTSGDDQDPP